MKCLIVGFVALTLVTSCLGCDPLPDGKECPPAGVVLYSDEVHCSKYWECNEGCGSHIVCQRDYLYNTEQKECQPPRQVLCGTRNCDNRDCMDLHLNDTTFDCPSDGDFPDPNNCIKYYACYAGVAEHKTCQKVRNGKAVQLYYDPINDWCNWPEDVDCGKRPICDENDENCFFQPEKTTTTAGPPDLCDQQVGVCQGEGLYEVGPCDSHFCQCQGAGGDPMQLECQPGLVFNPALDVCDFEENVPGC